MKRRHQPLPRSKAESGKSEYINLWELPPLSTAEQIGQACQVCGRTVLNWSKGPSPLIPIAFQAGKVIRFDPRAVAKALGLTMPESGGVVSLPDIRSNSTDVFKINLP